jgi:hypothetical protein
MTHNIIKTALISLALLAGTSLFAKQDPIEKVDISKLDRSMTLHQAKKRPFKSKQEFKKHRNVHHKKVNSIHPKAHAGIKKSSAAFYPDRSRRHDRYSRWDDSFDYDEPSYHYRHYGTPHRDFRRGWVLAYKYDRAEFYDRDGFHYGYFNRYGYMFEGEFYRYDRYYRYRDRVRGRGLFDRYYYRPVEWRYYGFCR